MSALPQFPFEGQPAEEPPVHRPRWKKVATWVGAGLAVLILLVVMAAVILLRSQAFHNYVLRVAQEKATAALGTQVQAQSFTLHFTGVSPNLDLYGVVVHGAGARSDPPLLQVEHIGVTVHVVSLLRRNWYLDDITVDRPAVRVLVDAQGESNIPRPKSSGGQSNTDVFDLGIRHARLNGGEVYYNNRKSVLNADLHDLSLQSAFDTGRREYSGTLGYRDGHIVMDQFNPIPHDLQARFSANPTTFTLQNAVLTSGNSQFVLAATVQDYSNPVVDARYQAVVDAGEFRRLLKNQTVPSGVIRVAGTMNYRSQPNVPMLQTVVLNGDVSSGLLRVQSGTVKSEIRNFGAKYALSNGNAEVRDIKARLLGGELTGTLTMRNITGASQSRLRANLRGVSLAELRGLANTQAMQQVGLSGTLNANADASWGKTTTNLVATSDADIHANVTQARQAGTVNPNTVPVSGIVHAKYSAANKQISLTQSYIRTPQTALTLNGTVSNRSSLQVVLQANNLHELETIADMFRTPTAGQPPQPLDLFGRARFTGAVRGTTSAPQLTGRLSAADLKVKGTEWRSLQTDVSVSPSEASLRNGTLQPAGRGRIKFDLSTGLKKWAHTNTSPIEVRLNASDLDAKRLSSVAGLKTPLTGTLSANVNLRGSQVSPVGNGDVTLTKAVFIEQLQLVKLSFQGTGNEVHANLTLDAPVGNARGVFTFFPKQEAYEGQLQANGIQLGKLKTLQKRNLNLNGAMNLTASGRGTLQNPGLQATIEIPQLTVQNQTMKGLTLNAAVANHVANVALDSEVLNTSVRGRGTVNLTGDYQATATLDTQPIALQPILAIYAPAQAANVTGQTELHATLRGPLKNKAAIDAHVTIPTLRVQYKNLVQIGAVEPIRVDFTNGVLTLQRSRIQGTGTDLQVQGTVPMNSAAPVSLLLVGTVNLQMAQLVDPEISSSGELRFNINSYGQRSDPNVQGQVQIVNANFATGTVPIGLQNGNGVLTVTKDRLNITEFRGTVGGGELTARGGVVYKPSLQFDLALAGKGIRMLYPDGVREAFDLNLALTGTKEASLVRGQVKVNDLSFTPDFDLTEFAGQFGGDTTPPPTGGITQNMKLDVAVQSTSGVNLVSRTLSLQAAANLQVAGTAAQPVILGRVNLNGGDLIFNGNRFVLQGGTIDFVNPVRTEPVVNVAVNTTIQQYDIRMQFWGPADHLHTTYASDPSLPPSDIINLLAFGKTTEASAANPSPPGVAGAQSLLASQVSSQVTSRVSKIAGISQLSVDPVLGSNQGQNPGARITIQQRVTGNLFVTFATDVTSTQRQVIQVQYNWSPRVSFSGTRDQNGGFGFDTRIHKNW